MANGESVNFDEMGKDFEAAFADVEPEAIQSGADKAPKVETSDGVLSVLRRSTGLKLATLFFAMSSAAFITGCGTSAKGESGDRFKQIAAEKISSDSGVEEIKAVMEHEGFRRSDIEDVFKSDEILEIIGQYQKTDYPTFEKFLENKYGREFVTANEQQGIKGAFLDSTSEKHVAAEIESAITVDHFVKQNETLAMYYYASGFNQFGASNMDLFINAVKKANPGFSGRPEDLQPNTHLKIPISNDIAPEDYQLLNN